MKDCTTFHVIDTHTGGEPTRVVMNGMPPIQARTMKEAQSLLISQYDGIRKALLHEPRGHKDMFGAIILPPVHPQSDFGVVFMDAGGYLQMCGHGSMGAIVALIEAGMLRIQGGHHEVTFDTPAGTIRAFVDTHDETAKEISIVNIPAFPYIRSYRVQSGCEVDIAFGGNFFALVNMNDVRVLRKSSRNIVEVGMDMLKEINQELTIQHPIEKHIQSVDLIHFYDYSRNRNLVIFGDGQIDRSPCGTGICAHMSVLHSQGKLREGEDFFCTSVLGTTFRGRILGTTQVGQYKAITPQITGRAFVTGIHKFIIDNNDPLKDGFLLHYHTIEEVLDC